MMMFEAFHNMYSLLREARENGGKVDPESEVFRTTMEGAEGVLHKHGKDPAQVTIREGSFLEDIQKL